MVGIGFFSPLPLAYMLPFMAAQSLAMGEAFGKGFQYGKRKISAMTNEEFNKFTFQNMWDEQNSNIKILLPSLNQQLDSSILLQKAIFKHMFDLIPLFINEMAKATSTIVGNLTFQNTGDSTNPFQEQMDAFNNWIKNIWNVPDAGADAPPDNPFIGPPEKLPDSFTQHIDIQKELLIPDPKDIPSAEVTAASVDQDYLDWITKLGTAKATFQTAVNVVKITGKGPFPNTKAGHAENIKFRTYWARALDATKVIRRMSNDTRNPNNHIRKNALRLRQELYAGHWDRNKKT